MTTYPENSLLAFKKAAELGFKHIELDIQLSSDQVPIVIHDDSLKRTVGNDNLINQLSAEEITKYKLIFNKNQPNISTELTRIAALHQVIDLLNNFKNFNLYVEIKRESVDYFDVETVVERVLKAVSHAKFTVVIISFVTEAVEYVQNKYSYPVGWVLKEYDKEYKSIAESMQPEYIYCNVKKIMHPSNLWKGPWRWALYDVKNPKKAKTLLEEGVDLIETGDIVKLTSSKYFQ